MRAPACHPPRVTSVWGTGMGSSPQPCSLAPITAPFHHLPWGCHLDQSQGCFGGLMSPFPVLLLSPNAPHSCWGTCFGAVRCLFGVLAITGCGVPVLGHRWWVWDGGGQIGHWRGLAQPCSDGAGLLHADAVTVQPAHRAVPGATGGGRVGGHDPAGVSVPCPPSMHLQP